MSLEKNISINTLQMEEQEKIWDAIAEEWNKFRRNPIDEVVEFLKNKDGKILDLGCGSGRNLIKINGKFYCVDFSKKMIKFAKENAKINGIKCRFFVSSSENLPFEKNFFDAAIYIAALHCIPEEKKRKESLKELFRVLKRDSKALITVWSKNHVKLVNHPKNSTVSWKKNSEELQRYYYLYDRDELEKLIKSAGFKVVSINDDGKNILAVARKP